MRSRCGAARGSPSCAAGTRAQPARANARSRPHSMPPSARWPSANSTRRSAGWSSSAANDCSPPGPATCSAGEPASPRTSAASWPRSARGSPHCARGGVRCTPTAPFPSASPRSFPMSPCAGGSTSSSATRRGSGCTTSRPRRARACATHSSSSGTRRGETARCRPAQARDSLHRSTLRRSLLSVPWDWFVPAARSRCSSPPSRGVRWPAAACDGCSPSGRRCSRSRIGPRHRPYSTRRRTRR